MPGGSSRSQKSQDVGAYLWRGGARVPLEKAEDRFTVMPASQEQLERVRSAPGVREIKPVTGQVYKVMTTARPSTCPAWRSGWRSRSTRPGRSSARPAASRPPTPPR